VRNPSGFTHFVVAWGQLAGRVQVMDPGAGRRFEERARFLEQVYVHTMAVPAAVFAEYARGEEFLRPLRAVLGALGAPRGGAAAIARASAVPCARAMAALDAAARMVSELVAAGGVARGEAAARLVDALVAETLARPATPPAPRPDADVDPDAPIP